MITHIIICLVICVCIIIIVLSQNYSSIKKTFYDVNKQHQHFGLSLLYDEVPNNFEMVNFYRDDEIPNNYSQPDDKELVYFSECNDASPDCIGIKYTIYDKRDHKKILEPLPHFKYLLPHIDKLPKSTGYCGFGMLVFDNQREDDPWECLCHAPEYLGGEMCDEPQTKLIRENKCSKIAHMTNLKNVDISTFNPFVEGVCVKCVNPELGYIPVMDSTIPMCKQINVEVEESSPIKPENVCFFDALNPHLYNSPFNKYVEGYGCVCDYYNGFVEVFLPDINTKNGEISNACIKIGKRKHPEEYHRTDLAYYCLQNNLRPIQIHSYENLEHPFASIFPNIDELLIKQQAKSECNENDWLNRHIKPNKQQPLYRLNNPKDTWPIVHKRHLVNQYTRRNETFPISAYTLSIGRGFEEKHWYETTSDRYMSNAIWSHPIIYTYHPGTKWTNKTTLNPLGIQYKQYYGLTLNTKPGEIVRLDTRGYNQEKGGDDMNVVTLPPNYKTEMLDPKSFIYIAPLYNNYKVTN